MKRSPGFTLLEVIIYMAFVAMIMSSVVLLSSTTFTLRSKLRAAVVLGQDIRFSSDRLNAYIAEASGVSSPAVGSSASSLVLTTSSSSTNPTTITVSGGVVTVTQATGTSQTLSSDEVSITSLSFTRVSSTAGLVRYVMTGSLRDAAASFPTLTVTTTAAVRR